MAKVIHTMIRVMDEAKSVEFYNVALGMTIADRYPFDGFTLTYLRNQNNDFEIELTINEGREEPYTHGTGYGHVAIGAPDVVGTVAKLAAMGAEVLTPPTVLIPGGPHVAFVKDFSGYTVELIQTSRT